MTRNKEILNSLITLTVREVRRFLRIWVQTLVPPAVTMSLYFVIFGSLIGPRIGEMNGLDYIQFMIPGLVMLSVITSSYANVVSSFFGVKVSTGLSLRFLSSSLVKGFIFSCKFLSCLLYTSDAADDNP